MEQRIAEPTVAHLIREKIRIGKEDIPEKVLEKKGKIRSLFEAEKISDFIRLLSRDQRLVKSAIQMLGV